MKRMREKMKRWWEKNNSINGRVYFIFRCIYIFIEMIFSLRLSECLGNFIIYFVKLLYKINFFILVGILFWRIYFLKWLLMLGWICFKNLEIVLYINFVLSIRVFFGLSKLCEDI